jgi:tetratricopeptide (TPR) repeat protein
VSSPAGLETPARPAAVPHADDELTGDGAAVAPRRPDEAAPPLLPRLDGGGRLALVLGGLLLAAALIAKAGGSLGATTTVEVGVTVIGVGVAAVAIVAGPSQLRPWGVGTLLLLAALTAWTALSVVWSVQPADTWLDANRAIAYLAAFAGAVGLARLCPRRVGAVVVAVLLATLGVSVIALIAKSFPLVFNSREELARLRQPLGYWNALGLLAACAVPAALWVGARREGAAGTRVLAFPAIGLALVTVALSYSRGALIALGIGLAFWFAFVPLRLRGLAVLLPSAVVAGGLSAWAFADDALSKDTVPLHDRVGAGHTLALLLVVLVGLLVAAGIGIERYRERQPPTPALRKRAGLAALAAVAAAPVAVLVALALAHGGVGGQVTQAWDNFFSSTSSTSYGPERLKSIGTRRGSYWREAEKVWAAHRWAGAGSAGYATARKRYRRDALDVQHAHGYVPQTMADLGLIGLAISLALLCAWVAAAARAAGARRRVRPRDLDPRRWPAALARAGRALPPALRGAHGRFAAAADRAAEARPNDPRRAAVLTLIAVVVTFGAHSLIDWTWLVFGTALVALVCAGYVAGLGPPYVPGREAASPIQGRLVGAGALVVAGLVALWGVWAPQRSASAGDAALASLSDGRTADALLQAKAAHDRDPLALEPLFDISEIEDAAGHRDLAQRALEEAVRLQPANPESWRQLASYQINTLNQPGPAFAALRAALFLDPQSPAVRGEFLDAFRRLPRQTVKPGAQPAKPANPVVGAIRKELQRNKPPG